MRTVHTSATVHEQQSSRARLIARSAKLTMKPLLRLAPVDDQMMLRVQWFSSRMLGAPASPDIDAVAADVGGVPGEIMRPAVGTTSDLTLLYLHGGGFFTGSVASYRVILEALVRGTGGTVIAIDYRQLPEHSVADSVQDAISAYEDVLGRAVDPAKVVVAGDSAGGYLTMKVAELATRRGLQEPAALIGFSPLLSLNPDFEGKDVLRVAKVDDAVLPASRVRDLRERWLPEGTSVEGFADPLHASAYIDSPVHLVAAESEFLRPEIEAFALLLDDKGVEVDLHLWRGQVHAFPLMCDRLDEAALAVQLAVQFALHHVGESAPLEVDDETATTTDVSGELAG